MNVGLVDPNKTLFHNGITYLVPMGLLSIAAVVESSGHDVEIVELFEHLSSDNSMKDRNSLPTRFSNVLIDKSFDILGFTTRSDTLPLVIEIARQHKLKRKEVPIVLGGPGATFVDQDILRAFPFVDVIVRREGEKTFSELLSAFEKHKDSTKINGITFRDTNGEIFRTPDRTAIRNLDHFPDASFHLIEQTLSMPNIWSIQVLVGRGCPNNCRFCSQKPFWGKPLRWRSPERVVAEMKMLNKKYGIYYFTLIHDNLLCNKKFVLDFCKLIRKYLPGVSFGICGSLNYSSPEIIKTLAHSGCKAIYVGIETASANTSRHITRKFCAPQNVHKILDLYRKYNIRTTKSYVIGFPDETYNDINQTLELTIEAQASTNFQRLEEVTNIWPLAINPGTELYDDYQDRLLFAGPVNYFSDSNIAQIESCLNLCKKYPTIFTSYASCLDKSKQLELLELCEYFRFLLIVFPKSLFVVLHELRIKPVQFFKDFKNYVYGANPAEQKNRNFRSLLRLFPKFVSKLYQDANCSQDFINFFTYYEQPRITILSDEYEFNDLFPGKSQNDDSLLELVPIIPATTLSVSLPCDPDRLFSKFRSHGMISIPRTGKKIHILYYVPRQSASHWSQEGFAIYKIDKRLEKILPYVVKFTDSKRSCSQIVDEIGNSLGFSKTPLFIEKRIWKKLKLLIQYGILRLSGEYKKLSKNVT